MLTARDIEEYPLEKASFGGGYKCESVDAFLDKIAADYQKLTDDNAALSKKISVLVDSINKYREDEDYIKSTLIESQKMAANTVSAANDQAASIIDDANVAAAGIIEDAENKGAAITAEYDVKIKNAEEYFENLKKSIDAFRSHLMATYKSHIESISELPVYEAPAKEEEEAAPAEEVEVADEAAEIADAVEEAAAEAEETAEEIAEEVEAEEAFVEPIEDEIAQALAFNDEDVFEDVEEIVEEIVEDEIVE